MRPLDAAAAQHIKSSPGPLSFSASHQVPPQSLKTKYEVPLWGESPLGWTWPATTSAICPSCVTSAGLPQCKSPAKPTGCKGDAVSGTPSPNGASCSMSAEVRPWPAEKDPFSSRVISGRPRITGLVLASRTVKLLVYVLSVSFDSAMAPVLSATIESVWLPAFRVPMVKSCT